MNTKARITKVERARAVQKNKSMPRIFVYNEHKDTGRLDGVPMSCVEWDKIKKDNDVTLVIRRASKAIKDGNA